MKISASKAVVGEITLPGDKSMSHRAAMFGAIAEGVTNVTNFSSSVDCASTVEILRQLGTRIDRNGSELTIYGNGKYFPHAPNAPLDCGNSGTTMRLMTGILAGQPFESVMIGDESLKSRPMRRVIDPAEKFGAKTESYDGHAPLKIIGKKPLTAISYVPNVASAQLKSCVLLGGLYADGTTTFLEKAKTRDHTERMLGWFGVNLDSEEIADGTFISVDSDEKLTAKDFIVPSDISSAAFFMVAAACLPGSDLTIRGVGLNPSRTAIIDVLQSCGADIKVLNNQLRCNEPVGDVRIRGGLKTVTRDRVVRGDVIANIIDEIPVLAVFGTQAEGGLEIRDAKELRVKESDRINAVVKNLKKMGANVEEFEDGFRVERSDLTGAEIETFDDHRIAMAFAVAGIFAAGETKIINPECVGVSFPEFFDVLARVTEK